MSDIRNLLNEYPQKSSLSSTVPSELASSMMVSGSSIVLNLLKILEVTLHIGAENDSIHRYGDAFTSFELLLTAFEKNLHHALTLFISAHDLPNESDRVQTLTLKNGGLINVAYSLLTIKSLVFEQQKFSLKALCTALNANFSHDDGHQLSAPDTSCHSCGLETVIREASDLTQLIHEMLGDTLGYDVPMLYSSTMPKNSVHNRAPNPAVEEGKNIRQCVVNYVAQNNYHTRELTRMIRQLVTCYCTILNAHSAQGVTNQRSFVPIFTLSSVENSELGKRCLASADGRLAFEKLSGE